MTGFVVGGKLDFHESWERQSRLFPIKKRTFQCDGLSDPFFRIRDLYSEGKCCGAHNTIVFESAGTSHR